MKKKHPTPYELWLKGCEELKTQVILIDDRKAGNDHVRVFKTLTELPPSADTNWNASYRTSYIAWRNETEFCAVGPDKLRRE